VKGERSKWKRELRLTLGLVAIVLLAAAVFTLGSLNIPLHPEQESGLVILFALSTFMFAALLVFSLIMIRSLVRLWNERRIGQMGSRFKAKMVLGALGVSLLPVMFLFFSSYALLNRTLNLWFPRPLEIANEESRVLLTGFGNAELRRLSTLASEAALRETPDQSFLVLSRTADAAWITDRQGQVTGGMDFEKGWNFGPELQAKTQDPHSQNRNPAAPKMVRSLASGAQVWQAGSQLYLAGSAPMQGSILFAARHLPDDFVERYQNIETQTGLYAEQKQRLRAFKREILLTLIAVTLILLSSTTWIALRLSKQVTVPIQGLAEATREISRGNFDHRIEVEAQDELGTLVRSFNRMTEQLGEGRRQINEFTRNLEQAIEEREGRRKLMEAILENIPTGVVSLSATGEVARVNSAIVMILGEHARNAHTLPELLGEEAGRAVLYLMRRSLRMGAASREIEIASAGRLLRAAVTVSSLGPRRSNPGFVVVIDDLTDLLRAQKAAAWQEVAQRIAHEIKNPLTPIQLSAQRLLRHLERTASLKTEATRGELERLVAECAGLIEREVQTLESLVDEFSQFARFPSARLASADLNSIVSSALDLFHGRLDGITVKTELAATLPPVKADPELMRRVVANLIDNAAEAMEGSTIRRLRVATRMEGDGDAVEIEISDSGHGISPEDKERLFLPHFSTRERGTGLGLAIASRIIAEHNGTIRVEDNLPSGARFLIRFPAAEVVATQTQTGGQA
jgi:two-component system, NtrC family, nitrogen regulation sensor histidine kinase NtrY